MNTTLHQNRPEDSQNWTNLYLEPHGYRIRYVNIDFASSVWNLCRWVADVPPPETSPAAKSEEKRMFSQAREKGVFHKIPAFPVMSLTKILETFIRSFSSSFNRKYFQTVACTVVFVGPARLVCNAYLGRNATCSFSSCSNKNDGHAVALTDFYRCL